jgi:hypothetical protein
MTAPSTPNGPRVLITTRDVDFRDVRLAPSQRCAHVQLAGLGRGEALALGRAVLVTGASTTPGSTARG